MTRRTFKPVCIVSVLGGNAHKLINRNISRLLRLRIFDLPMLSCLFQAWFVAESLANMATPVAGDSR